MLDMRRVCSLVLVAFVSAACSLEPSEVTFHASFCEAADLQRLVDEEDLDPNDTFDGGASPIWTVVAASSDNTGCLEALEVLIDAGGDVNRTENGFSLLWVALNREIEPGIVAYIGELGVSPCGPITDHVNFEALEPAREALNDTSPLPESLLELAESNASEASLAEFRELLANADCE